MRSLWLVVAVALPVGAAAQEPSEPEALPIETAGSEATALDVLRLEDLMEIQVKASTKAALPVREAPTVGSAITRDQIESYARRLLATRWFTRHVLINRWFLHAHQAPLEPADCGWDGLAARKSLVK